MYQVEKKYRTFSTYKLEQMKLNAIRGSGERKKNGK